MKNHTPGPWNVTTGEGAHHRDLYIRGPKNVGAPHNVAVARICSSGNSKIECDANAHLIAAVPDLLKALKMLWEHRGVASDRPASVDKAVLDAIAKAEETAK